MPADEWAIGQITAQHEHRFTAPENIYYRRNQRNNDDAKIGKPGLFVAYRCKTKAVEQSADADGREDRQDDSTDDGLELQHKQRCMMLQS